MSASSLSQTIRELEERLGVRLLNRTTRSVAPSEAGARLLARLLPALADLDAAVADIAALRDTPSGLLRINAPRIAAVHHLAPLIGPFLDRKRVVLGKGVSVRVDLGVRRSLKKKK